MLPTRYSTLFRSRWKALFWAAGICWSAVMFVGFSDHHDNAAANGANQAGAAADDTSVNDLQALVAKLDP